MDKQTRWGALGAHLETGLRAAAGTAAVAGAVLLLGSCAASNVQASGCTDHDDCNPGYHCHMGECLPGNPDGGPPDAFYFPPSDALPPDATFECAAIDFTETETQEFFEVPANVRYMHVKAWGAGGNGEGGCTYDNGGRGGYSEAVFEVTPGTPLIVIVGKRGRSGMTGEEVVKFGFGNWGGGGLSGIFLGPDLIDENSADLALIIAGGGGSAGVPGCDPGGTGNHPDSGGMPTLLGGEGAAGFNGGAGGYRGGVGGTVEHSSMGGSGFVDETIALDWKILYVEPGDGPAPGSDEDEYDLVAGTTEQSGMVFIRFVCTQPGPL
jgi:hypothetical protein